MRVCARDDVGLIGCGVQVTSMLVKPLLLTIEQDYDDNDDET